MKEDLRVYRTKKLLRDSIIDLAVNQSKKLADITVQEICDHALVHRTTFYRYYTDKYDLLLKELKVDEQLTTEERKARLLTPFSLAFNHSPIPNIDKLVTLNVEDEHLQFLINKMTIRTLTEDLSTFIAKESLPVPLDVAVKIYSSVMDELVNQWVKNGTKDSPELMDHYLRSVLHPFYFELLGE